MAWVVDTCVLLDIRLGHPEEFAHAAATCLRKYMADELIICPVTFVEMAPAFHGNSSIQMNWLDALNISYREVFQPVDILCCHQLWDDYIQRKRRGTVAKRPVADILIAGFSMRFQGIITRNITDFRTISSSLSIIHP